MLLRYESDEQLKTRLDQLFAGMKLFLSPYGNNAIELNYACGVYVIINRELPIDYCHENAQMAKQSVKELYDTTVSFYDDILRQQVIETQVIEASMYQGLENDEFEIYLQPKYDLKTETVAGAEALIRWHHPTLGFLTPYRFIPIFEHNGFLLKLDCLFTKRFVACCKAG
jgi:predicted signal transduction protein with EAL and GGDEF domain